jgi:Tfp pilus assembly protein FimT
MAEVVVVLAIASLVSMIAAPQLNHLLSNYRLNGAARLIWGDLQNARMTAIKENRSIRVDFDVLARTYSFTRADTGQVFFTRNLNPDYPAITALKSGGGSITFTSNGATLNNENATVLAQRTTETRSIEIKGTGKITLIGL